GCGGCEALVKGWGRGTNPRPPLPLLAPSLTEGGSTDQRLPCVGPAIRMGVMGVVDVKLIHQTGFQVLRGAKITPFQKTARQDAKPQLDLIQPGAMDGRKVKHM